MNWAFYTYYILLKWNHFASVWSNLTFPSFALANHKAQGDLQTVQISCMVLFVFEIDVHTKVVLSCEKSKIFQIEVNKKKQENCCIIFCNFS